eukprot:5000647-Pyramimonas_sp.AAC.1
MSLVRRFLGRQAMRFSLRFAAADVLQQMTVAPQSFVKKVIIAFPSVPDVQETLRCFRMNFPDGFGCDTPRGQ